MTDRPSQPNGMQASFRKGLGLKFKFSLVISLLIVIIMGSVTYVILTQVEKSLMEQMTNKGIAITRGLANNAAEALAMADQMLLSELVDQAISQDQGILLAALVNSQGRIIAHSQNNLEGLDYQRLQARPYLTTPTATISRCVIDGADCLDFSLPIVYHAEQHDLSKKLGYAHLVYSLTPIAKTIKETLLVIFYIAGASLGLGIILALLVVNRITNPIRKLSQGAQIVGAGNLDYNFQVTSKDEIGQLSHTLNHMTINLKSAQQEMIIKERLENEMAIAKEIQDLLIPKKAPALNGFSIGMLYRSAMEVSGDYLDFLELDTNHWGMIVADVSGKGIPGGLVMAQTRSVLHSIARNSLSPAKTLATINRQLINDIRENMFVTSSYLILDVGKRQLSLARAGHLAAIVYRRAQSSLELVKPVGIAIGATDAEIFEKVLAEATVVLNPGDFIFLHTDGIDEATNNQNELFGMERLHKILIKTAGQDAPSIIQTVDQQVKTFLGAAPQNDDMTMILVKRNE